MNLPLAQIPLLLIALVAILMVGSTHLRLNIWLFSAQALLVTMATALSAVQHSDSHLYIIAALLFVLKVLAVPKFFMYIIEKVEVQRDTGTVVRAPVAMLLSIAFLWLSYILARQLPVPSGDTIGWPGATAAISLLCTGLLLMLTRRIALSQIIGFLVMENGIYIFGLTQTNGMPMFIEMGILLDVLAGVMLAGLIAFRIKKNFEHIDVTMLTELKENL